MSQATLLPTSPVTPSFPPLAYQGVPVLTTEMLAQAYEVEPHQIRQNFKNNRERFVEGKHFFTVTNGELRDFRLQVESFYSQISPKVRALTLWTERGAARNAKMLNSDRAWDVFELLEETFFRVVRTDATPAPGPDAPAATLPLSTTEDRKPLRALVGSWAQVSGLPFAACWNQLKAAFQLANIKHLPKSWIPDALAWVQEKMDALPAPQLPTGKESLTVATATAAERQNFSVQQDIMNRISRAEVSLGSAIEVMRLFGNPKAHPSKWGNMMPEMASNLYNTAHAALVSAYNALEAAERLRHGRF